MPAALTMDPPNEIAPESPGVSPGEERERLARRADRERREAALILSAEPSRCPQCKGPVVIGATVRVVHAATCPRQRAMIRAKRAAAAGTPVRRPVAADVPAPRTAEPGPGRETAVPAASVRHANRQSDLQQHARTGQSGSPVRRLSKPRIRPAVVQSWRVAGTRITVDGWPATVASEIRTVNGVPSVRLDFDDFDDFAPEDQAEIPDWWDLEDLTRPQHALAA